MLDDDELATACRTLLGAVAIVRNDDWTSYSRDRTWYVGRGRYLGSAISYTRVRGAIDLLLEAGLIEDDRVPKGNRKAGRQSRYRATSRLRDLMDGEQPEYVVECEVLRLRDADGRPVDYNETRWTRRQRRRIERLNARLRHVRLTLPEADYEQVEADLIRVGTHYVRIAPHVELYRSFSRKSWTKGGRVYSWIACLPKLLREGMLIDGEEVIEIDFAAHHASLLFAQVGIDITDGVRVRRDAYKVPGWDAEHERPYVKAAFNTLVNARDREQARWSLMSSETRTGEKWPYDGFETNRLIDMTMEHNPEIAGFFHSDRGIDLQNDDAEMALRIVEACAERGIVCLPVHDSFIVQARHKAMLEAIMTSERDRYVRRQIDRQNHICAAEPFLGSNPLSDGRFEHVRSYRVVGGGDEGSLALGSPCSDFALALVPQTPSSNPSIVQPTSGNFRSLPALCPVEPVPLRRDPVMPSLALPGTAQPYRPREPSEIKWEPGRPRHYDRAAAMADLAAYEAAIARGENPPDRVPFPGEFEYLSWLRYGDTWPDRVRYIERQEARDRGWKNRGAMPAYWSRSA
jgi:hypothetical protein